MATTRVRTSKRSETKAAPPVPTSEFPRVELRLSPVGEYFRQIAERYTPGRVQVDPHRQSGKPVLDDTRIPVHYVLGQLADGKSWAEITAEYPEVTTERIRAALEFAHVVFWRTPVEIE